MAKSSGNVAAAYRFLRGKGLSPVAAAGAVGGLTGESGPNLDPSARNPTSGAIGIGQWLGGRAAGVKAGDLQGQLNHLWGELSGSERGALQSLKGAKSAGQAAEIWTRQFERPSPGEIAGSLGARKAAAARILAQHGGDPGTTSSSSAPSVSVTGNVTPAQATPDRGTAAEMVLQRGSKTGLQDFRTSRLGAANNLFKLGLATTPGTTGVTEQVTTKPGTSQEPARSAGSGTGSFKITGANPSRLQPKVVAFANKVAAQFGEPLTGDSGATHSKMTVDGNVSDHWAGNATDIPGSGTKLLHMGQAALIAAGMPRAQALKQKGGLYNVNGHQIIFLTMQGGNHFNHLHISAK